MKQVFYFFTFLLIFAHPTFAQSVKEHKEVKKAFSEYLKAFQQKDFEGILDLIYPKLYELVSREKMKKALTSSYTKQIEFKNFKIKKVSKVIEHQSIKYASLECSGSMFVHLSDEEMEGADMVVKYFKSSFGESKVKKDLKNQRIIVETDILAMAILDPAYTGWMFIQLDSKDHPLFAKVIPKEVIDKF